MEAGAEASRRTTPVGKIILDAIDSLLGTIPRPRWVQGATGDPVADANRRRPTILDDQRTKCSAG